MNSVEELIDEIRQGKMVVMVDDEDRENEGDLIMAASKVRPEDINFMARHARGLICMPLTREHCERLKLPLMVNGNQSAFHTNFTVSIEAARGVTTGISAHDRAVTIQAAVAENAQPEDLAQPGHVFPLMAQPGGVLTRAGHTEAATDLAALAGLPPAGTLVEILNDDGSMARRPQLEEFAAAHDLKIGSIADLIHYRLANEKTIEREFNRQVSTEFGDFHLVAYRDVLNRHQHLAMVKGKPQADQNSLVRVHVQNVLSDVLTVTSPDQGMPVRYALEQIAEADTGVLVVLNDDTQYDQLIHRLGIAPADLPRIQNQQSDEIRTYGIGAQILSDLGVGRMTLISAPKNFLGLSGFGLHIEGYHHSSTGTES